MAILTVDRTIQSGGDEPSITAWLATTQYDLTAALQVSYDNLASGPFNPDETWTSGAKSGVVHYDDGVSLLILTQSAGAALADNDALTSSGTATADVNGTPVTDGVIERGLVGAEERDEVNNWSGATVDQTRHRRLECTGSALHAGVWDEAKGHLTNTTGNDHVLHILEDWVHLKGLQIFQAEDVSSLECVRVEADNVLIEKTLLRVRDTGTQDCIYTGASAVDELAVFDCCFHLEATCRGGVHNQVFSGSHVQTIRVEHCTIDANGADGGIITNEGSGTVNMHCYSTYAADATTDYSLAGGTTAWTGAGSKSSDASATARMSGSNVENSVALTATDSGGAASYLVTSLTSPGDYQLLEGAAVDNAAIDEAIAPVDARDSRIDILLDVAGNTRNTTFTLRDVGAFDVAAAPPAGGSPPALTLLGVG